MKYCLNFRKSNKYIDEVAEINIIWKDTSTLTGLRDFLNKHHTQRINISFEIPNSLGAFLQKLEEMEDFDCKNFAIKITDTLEDSVYLEDIMKLTIMKIPFYFDRLVKDWESLVGLKDLGVSDVYISGALGFDLIRVREWADKYNINIRAFPNWAQSTWGMTPAFRRFFIRPEDVEYCEGLIDVLEFYDSNAEATLYEIYQSGEWNNLIHHIIRDFDIEFYNNLLAPVRWSTVDCRQKCLVDGKCNICEKLFSLGETLAEKGFSIKKQKNEEVK